MSSLSRVSSCSPTVSTAAYDLSSLPETSMDIQRSSPEPSLNEDVYEGISKITSTGEDRDGQFVVLESTIFKPPQQGKPSDQGIIQTLNKVQAFIHKVKKGDKETIQHYYKSKRPLFYSNQTVAMIVNSELREFHKLYREAGLLIADKVEEIFSDNLIAFSGHYFPKDARVKFTHSTEPENCQPTEVKEILKSLSLYISTKAITIEAVKYSPIGQPKEFLEVHYSLS